MKIKFDDVNVKQALIAHSSQFDDAKLIRTIEKSGIEIIQTDNNNLIYITAKSTKHKKLLNLHEDHFQQALTSAFGLSNKTEIAVRTVKEKTTTAISFDQNEKVSTHTAYSELEFGKSNQSLKYALDELLSNTMFSEKYLICGPNASGKSTIMKAFSQELQKQNLKTRIITAGKFSSLFVDRVRSKDWTNWENEFNQCDVLILEDISAIKSRKKTLNSLLQVLSEFTSHDNKHLLITTQEPIQSLDLKNRELVEFFESMTPLRIEKPSEDIIGKLLSTFFKTKKISCAPKTRRKLMDHFVSKPHTFCGITKSINMKYLALTDQATNDVNHVNDLSEANIDPSGHDDATALFSKAVDSVLENTKSTKEITCELIINSICEFYSVDRTILLKPGRTEPILEARQMASYLLRTEIGWSFPQIGKYFGQSHTTALNSITKVTNILKAKTLTNQQNHYSKLLSMLK